MTDDYQLTDAELSRIWNHYERYDKCDLIAMIMENWSDFDYAQQLKFVDESAENIA